MQSGFLSQSARLIMMGNAVKGVDLLDAKGRVILRLP
jgi:hypothetical protein